MKNLDFLLNKHTELGFVIGAGPSLREVDNNTIKKYPKICVNSAISKFPESNYFLSDDWDSMSWNYFQSINQNTVKLLYKEKFKDKDIKGSYYLFNHKFWYNHLTNRYEKDGLELTKDPNLPIIGARTSIGSAIHFAYIMGFNPIVLLGCDCCFEGNKRYFWEYEDQKQCYRIDNKSLEKRISGKIDGRLVDRHSLDFLKYWEALSKQLEKQKIKVINASDGILKFFERKDLKDIIKEYG